MFKWKSVWFLRSVLYSAKSSTSGDPCLVPAISPLHLFGASFSHLKSKPVPSGSFLKTLMKAVVPLHLRKIVHGVQNWVCSRRFTGPQRPSTNPPRILTPRTAGLEHLWGHLKDLKNSDSQSCWLKYSRFQRCHLKLALFKVNKIVSVYC